MPQHYSKATVAVQVWCKVCHKDTMHRVDYGRRGPCLECLKKLEDNHGTAGPSGPRGTIPQQGDLFR